MPVSEAIEHLKTLPPDAPFCIWVDDQGIYAELDPGSIREARNKKYWPPPTDLNSYPGARRGDIVYVE